MGRWTAEPHAVNINRGKSLAVSYAGGANLYEQGAKDEFEGVAFEQSTSQQTLSNPLRSSTSKLVM